MKLKFLLLYLILQNQSSYSLSISSNRMCSTEIKFDNLYKIYNTNLYKIFRDVLILKNFPESSIPMLFCISKFESGFNGRAINLNANGSIDSGLFQINQIWNKECGYKINTLEDNINCAHIVLKKQGLTAWSSYKKYKYVCSEAINKMLDLN